MDREKHVMAGGDDTKATTNIPNSSSTSSCVNENKNSKLYKGVRKRKWGKWVSEIRFPNSRERIWLGSYDSAEKAARAFDAALYCLRGRHATFNFPDTPYNVALPPHKSLTPQEIQEVASKFANEVGVNQQQQTQQHGNCGDGDGNCNSSSLVESTSNINTPTTTASSCSTMLECDGTVQVENGDNMMDWTFLNAFDYSNEVVPVASDYSLYSELDKITMHSGELLYSTPPPPTIPFDDDDDDPFSHQSFLWNWNF